MVIVVSVFVFAVCAAVLVSWHLESKNAQNAINEFDRVLTESETAEDDEKPYIKNCVAWIEIPGTDIDYPIMRKQGNPEYYLRRNYKGEYSYSGTPFLDENCNIRLSKNLIVYGHNMKDGTMFSELTKYKDLKFCIEHQAMKLTIDGITYNYTLYAVCSVDASEGWYTFTGQTSEDNFAELISHIQNRSSYISFTEQAEYGDHFLTLSTCDYASDNSRLIVIAKRSD
ncbi:sortase SrtB family [Clostridium sp. CAG:678]|nr:sortase SrtB family [Clostridium sp. CAG:678]